MCRALEFIICIYWDGFVWLTTWVHWQALNRAQILLLCNVPPHPRLWRIPGIFSHENGVLCYPPDKRLWMLSCYVPKGSVFAFLKWSLGSHTFFSRKLLRLDIFNFACQSIHYITGFKQHWAHVLLPALSSWKSSWPSNLFAEKKAPETQRDLESTSSFVACSSGGMTIFGLRQTGREAGKQGAGSLAPLQLLAFLPRPGLPGQNSFLAPARPCSLHRKPQWQLRHLGPSTRPRALANISPTLAAWVTRFPFYKHVGVLWI